MAEASNHSSGVGMFTYIIVTQPKEYAFTVWQIASETLCICIGMHKFWVWGRMGN
jgi:hypothetical protein